jgi:DNA-binding PadR family transcriptional regulator
MALQLSGRGPAGKLYEARMGLGAAGLAQAEQTMTGARASTVYTVTPAGRRALKAWLSEPPVPPSFEFEGMVKVFFADGGTLEQLRANLASVAETAEERLRDLEAKVEELSGDEAPFAQRSHLNVLGLRFVVDHERSLAEWARWALAQIEGWHSTTDPGGWDHRRAFSSNAR